MNPIRTGFILLPEADSSGDTAMLPLPLISALFVVRQKQPVIKEKSADQSQMHQGFIQHQQLP
ncbi:MAG: hypothetical protein RLY97_1030 [Pseudomonadota bacterium]